MQTKLNVDDIIARYYDPQSPAWQVLMTHSRLVTAKALQLAENVAHLQPDTQFIAEAAMLHDIGIYLTDAPQIGCFGKHHYLSHGYLGREILEKEGLPKHALVCERHTGVGLSAQQIQNSGLPLPHRDMRPVSLEEKIICFADCFYSKAPGRLEYEKSLAEIRASALKFDPENGTIVDDWAAFFDVTDETTVHANNK